MKAAVVHSFTEPLRFEEVATPVPGEGEVLVRIEASGLCHTDIHAAHGDWPVKPTPPFVPGHEGVGIVEQLGAGVTAGRLGDRVAVPWLGCACGTLRPLRLRLGDALHRAAEHRLLGRRRLRRVRHRRTPDFVVRVPDGVDPLDAAPLTCAGVTTYKAVKVSGARSSDLVAVFGIGGLGHLAVQYAQDRRGARRRGRPAGRQARARARARRRLHGQRGEGGPGRRDPGARRRRRRDRPRGRAEGVRAGLRLAPPRRHARVRRPAGGERVELPIFETVLNGITIVGSIVGTRTDLREVFELHAAGRTRVIREERPLAEVNEAIADVEAGRVPARVVFEL